MRPMREGRRRKDSRERRERNAERAERRRQRRTCPYFMHIVREWRAWKREHDRRKLQVIEARWDNTRNEEVEVGSRQPYLQLLTKGWLEHSSVRGWGDDVRTNQKGCNKAGMPMEAPCSLEPRTPGAASTETGGVSKYKTDGGARQSGIERHQGRPPRRGGQ